MFTKILIANRGEIACRVIKTAQSMGISTVAVYSDIDRDALHVSLADEAFYLGGNQPSQSYLDGAKILAICHQAKAQAIHPGYGFLSESAEFAKQCQQKNICFIGPSSAAIEAMGSKSAAKEIMSTAGVPQLPGYHGKDNDDACLIAQAIKIGFPLLIKAALGGGGKGMRIVDNQQQLPTELSAARREAMSAFGDAQLLLEPYLTQARHVEVQIFADAHGNCVYLSDRDCSVQRRHQKILEEAPAPGLSDTLRQQMGQAAVNAAKAIHYQGAGTVEFLLDDKHNFYFMEMNTRLQVEHPVTEMITGVDLVQWQLQIACGSPLPLTQQQIKHSGHAIEVRVYAEDPSQQFLPASGTIDFLRHPPITPRLRIDSGVVQHSLVSSYYDPMIAKLIVHGDNRTQALQQLSQALSGYYIGGVKHNIRYLRNICQHSAMLKASVHTQFIEQYHQHLLEPSLELGHEDTAHVETVLILKLIVPRVLAGFILMLRQTSTHAPLSGLSGFRLNAPKEQHVAFMDEQGQPHRLSFTHITNGHNGHYHIHLEGQDFNINGHLIDNKLIVELNGHQQTIFYGTHEDKLTLFLDDDNHVFSTRVTHEQGEKEQHSDQLKAPMNGRVISHLVNQGDAVTSGQGLVVMEAMKMEYTIEAPFDGVINELYFTPGQLVEHGVELVDMACSPITKEVSNDA